MTDRVVGVDGWRSGWVAASISANAGPTTTAAHIELTCHEGFDDLLAAHGAAGLIGVDIPLSLPRAAERTSDAPLRQHLGARSSSLFPTPCREAAYEPTWEEANATNRHLVGKGMSKQTWNLVPKLIEARAALLGSEQRAYEVHPESTLVAMGGSDQLGSKKTAAGIGRRLALLEVEFGALGETLASSPPGPSLDDVLDAIAVCWTLRRIVSGEALWFGPVGVDDEGFETGVPV